MLSEIQSHKTDDQAAVCSFDPLVRIWLSMTGGENSLLDLNKIEIQSHNILFDRLK